MKQVRSDQAGPAANEAACPCPVCAHPAGAFLVADGASYYRCGACQARFLDPARRLARAAEYAHYLHHENDVDDPGYRRFLSKLADPLLARLRPRSCGLDYGCGPGPALAAMLGEAGHEMDLYDPFFAPEPSVLQRTYDFVTCTETAEHFHEPAREFERLRALVRPGGWLAIMTCFQTDDARFAGWHYRKDPTHVVFYRRETFGYLADKWSWQLDIPVKDVALLRKPN